MYYSQDDDVKFEVGDILTHSNTYDRSPVIEVVTFVGNEGVVLQSIGGIVGNNAWMGKKYGRLNKTTWRDDLRAGFVEAFRVLQATQRTHLQMERNTDTGRPDSGAYSRETSHLAAHRQSRQNALDYLCEGSKP